MSKCEITVASDFSRFPAGRFRDDGPYTGERFREDFLVPALKQCEVLTVDLDGVMGYGSSFLEEAFGGLVRVSGFDSQSLCNKIRLVSRYESVKEEIREYIGCKGS